MLATVRAYREAMGAFAAMRNLEVWYAHLPVEQALAEFTAGRRPEAGEEGGSRLAKARTKDSMHAFAKLTHLVDGEPRIISDPPLIVPIDELLPASATGTQSRTRSATLIRGYRRTLETDRRHLLEQFRFVDLARKVVGVGSVGTRAWIALFLGRRPGPAVPAGQGGPALGARAVRRQERRTTTAASGSSPASA